MSAERPHAAGTLGAAVEEFLLVKRLEQRSPATLANYAQALARFAAFAGAAAPLDRLDRQTLRRYLAGLAEAGLAGSTRHKYGMVLKTFLAWAGREELGVALDLPARVQLPAVDTEQPDPFSAGELRRLYAAIRGGGWRPARTLAIVSVLHDVGLRVSELCALELRDVELLADARPTGRLVVRAATSKSRRERAVDLGHRARRDLHAWLQLRARWPAHERAPLFCTREGGRLERRTVERLLWRLGERAGVPDVHPHRFRHTCAIGRIADGQPPHEVQVLLGHTTLAMTMRYAKIVRLDIADSTRSHSPRDKQGRG